MRAGALSYSAVKFFWKYSNLHVCDHGTWTLQTDGQTAYCGITALCVASRGKNYSLYQGGYVIPCVCLFVRLICLLAALLAGSCRNYWSDPHENFTSDREELIKFWKWSGCLGGNFKKKSAHRSSYVLPISVTPVLWSAHIGPCGFRRSTHDPLTMFCSLLRIIDNRLID